MKRRSTGDDGDSPESFDLFFSQAEILKGNRALFPRDASSDGIDHRLWLLEDLFEHEMLVAPFLCHQRAPVDISGFNLEGFASEILNCRFAV